MTVALLLWSPLFVEGEPLLSAYAPPAPPYPQPGWSRQLPPIYTGLDALALRGGIRGGHAKDARVLPAFVAQYLEGQSGHLVRLLRKHGVEVAREMQLEMWPGYDDDTGAVTWVWARWRRNSTALWQWVPSVTPDDVRAKRNKARRGGGGRRRRRGKGTIDTSPIFPYVLRPWVTDDLTNIFSYPPQLSDLYAEPYFGDCLWGPESTSQILAAWLPPENFDVINKTRAYIRAYNQKAPLEQRLVCRVLPVPSYFNGIWETYVANATLRADNKTLSLELPSFVKFVNGPTHAPSVCGTPKAPVIQFPSTFDSDWLQEIVALTQFTHKCAGDSQNKLDAVRALLRSKYSALGLGTFDIDASTYMGIPNANVVAIIPGSDASLKRSPVIVCDHYDTVFGEDTFNKNGSRISVPGADDNGSATATLIRAAHLIRNPKRDVWLVHLTGEEFPADGLGGRALDAMLLLQGWTPKAVVVLDMLSWRANASDTIFQVNAGDSLSSLGVAACALDTSVVVNTTVPINAVLRPRFDPLSYLYNTDAVTFAVMCNNNPLLYSLLLELTKRHTLPDNGLANDSHQRAHQSRSKL